MKDIWLNEGEISMIPKQELWESAFLFGFGLAILDLASVSILVLGLGQAKQNCTFCKVSLKPGLPKHKPYPFFLLP